MKKRRVLIVDDHPVLRRGLAQLINQMPDLHVSGDVASIAEAVTSARNEVPEIAVVDISLKNESGLDLIPKLLEIAPDLPILVLSIFDEEFYATLALKAGARGYLTKQEAVVNIFVAIREVLAGNIYLSERLKTRLGEG
jgi:DNA-binding NarL/FixJ family response regulator